jgi:hypothetical protein
VREREPGERNYGLRVDRTRMAMSPELLPPSLIAQGGRDVIGRD